MSDKPQITPDVLIKVNDELLRAAFEQRDDEAPSRLPRLSKPPAQEAKAA